MYCDETKMTVWHRSGTDTSGAPIWHTVLYDTMFGSRRTGTEDAAGSGMRPMTELLGFLCPAHGMREFRHLTPERDYMACGNCTAYATPRLASAGGHTVYLVKEYNRPARISTGMLADFCRFRAESVDGCGM